MFKNFVCILGCFSIGCFGKIAGEEDPVYDPCPVSQSPEENVVQNPTPATETKDDEHHSECVSMYVEEVSFNGCSFYLTHCLVDGVDIVLDIDQNPCFLNPDNSPVPKPGPR